MPRSKQEQAVGTQSKNLLLDYYLTREIENNLPWGYSTRVVNNLAKHKIRTSRNIVFARARRIVSGKAVLTPSADVDGTPSAREGKDQCYAGFWTLVDIALPNTRERHYIGLAANQLDVVRSKTTSPIITVCELDPRRAIELANLAEVIERFRPGPKVQIVARDIFKEIENNQARYNIFDLDLMCHLPDEKKIAEWTKKIYFASIPGKIVIGITTAIGRKGNTEERYNRRTVFLRHALESAGFQELGYSRFAYRDRIVPMRSERFILTKEEKGVSND